MDDTTPTELVVATGETNKLEDTVTLLDTGLDLSPVAVATGDATPELTVPDKTATVEDCGSTLVVNCIVAFLETATLVDGGTPDVFSAEAV